MKHFLYNHHIILLLNTLQLHMELKKLEIHKKLGGYSAFWTLAPTKTLFYTNRSSLPMASKEGNPPREGAQPSVKRQHSIPPQDNLCVNQIQAIRQGLRVHSAVVMGKNTLMKRSIAIHSSYCWESWVDLDRC
ncbi:hypothetical protein L1987_10747 [Smallanthus sonchifolius]|uniref:Uncharacterized protein n=1 Tax=Smallanthus sonchifolius TaxID=185202 RepID=A0ACB9J9Z3_9ASTR|nr:hypothetical protein L1987_10747 [Smallanthus sonchifolius]